MKLLTNEQKKSYEIQKFVLFVKKNLKINVFTIKTIVKLGTIANIQENIELLHIEYVT